MTRGVDVVPSMNLFPTFKAEKIDVVPRADDFKHPGLFVDFAPHLLGVVEQDFVVNGAIHLEGRGAALALVLGRTGFVLKLFERKECYVPQFARLAPTVGAAELDREIGGFDLVPTTHFFEDGGDAGQLRFSHVVAGKFLPLEDPDLEVGIVFLKQSASCAATGAAANNRDIEVHTLILQRRADRGSKSIFANRVCFVMHFAASRLCANLAVHLYICY